MRTDTKILIQAMHHLANDIQSEDGVANAAIGEAGYRLEELHNMCMELCWALEDLRRHYNEEWAVEQADKVIEKAKEIFK